MKLSVNHLSRAKTGETVNGDAVVVRVGEGAHNLLAVVDALGHGPIAAQAAAKASRYLETISMEAELRTILNGLHGELKDTRGAAAMVCAITTKNGTTRIEGCGVGNVELRASTSSIPVVLSPGILGGSVRQFRFFQGTLHHHHRLVIFSDGISARFSLDSFRHLTPREMCQRVMSEHGRNHDDATVLVADCES
jgi:negative regulator of sigma-B (phosphoserine phosphatase)